MLFLTLRKADSRDTSAGEWSAVSCRSAACSGMFPQPALPFRAQHLTFPLVTARLLLLSFHMRTMWSFPQYSHLSPAWPHTLQQLVTLGLTAKVLAMSNNLYTSALEKPILPHLGTPSTAQYQLSPLCLLLHEDPCYPRTFVLTPESFLPTCLHRLVTFNCVFPDKHQVLWKHSLRMLSLPLNTVRGHRVALLHNTHSCLTTSSLRCRLPPRLLLSCVVPMTGGQSAKCLV